MSKPDLLQSELLKPELLQPELLQPEPLYVAADLGGTKIRSAVFDSAMQPLFKNQSPSLASAGRDSVLAALDSALAQALAFAHECMADSQDYSGVAGIGISTAGVVDTASGRILDATDAIPHWRGTGLAAHLRAHFALPVAVENDVKAALLGELSVAPELQSRRVVMLTLGTGLGGAIAEGGKIVSGAHSLAGHFGRMPVPSPWGGGGTIPLECLVSGSGLALVANKVAGEPLFMDGRAVLDGAHAGHARALLGLERFCDFLVMALQQIYWALDPDHILIGGGLVEAREHWWAILERKLKHSGLAIQVRPAKLHNDAGVFGAGALIRAQAGATVSGEPIHAR